jgi:hypothetical protein
MKLNKITLLVRVKDNATFNGIEFFMRSSSIQFKQTLFFDNSGQPMHPTSLWGFDIQCRQIFLLSQPIDKTSRNPFEIITLALWILAEDGENWWKPIDKLGY